VSLCSFDDEIRTARDPEYKMKKTYGSRMISLPVMAGVARVQQFRRAELASKNSSDPC
jgi:hypothetical protein